MKVVSVDKEGNLVFNWDLLPNRVSKNIKLRDKIFKKAQEKFPPGDLIFNNKLLYEINQFVFDEIKRELGGFK